MSAAAKKALTQNRVFRSTASEIQDRDIRLPAQAAEVFSFPRGAMAQRGRPRKDGQRKPGGQLRYANSIDRGHDLTLAHRAAIIAGANPKDQRAGYPLGVLRLRGEIDDAEHQAGLIYAGLHAVVYGGSKTPRSHLASIVASICAPLSDVGDDDRDTIHRRCAKQLREAVARLCIEGRRPMQVLENTVIYEHRMRFMETASRRPAEAWVADMRDLDALKRALGALVSLFKLERAAAAA